MACDDRIALLPAETGDLLTIAHLRREVWKNIYRGILPDDSIDRFDIPYHLEKDAAKLQDPTFRIFLLRLEGQPVGYLFYQIRKDHILLHSLNIIRSAQRQGIGRAALTHVAEECRTRQLDHFRLQCNPWNQNAMDFYQAMGGVIVKKDLNNEAPYMDSTWFRFSVSSLAGGGVQ